MLLLVFILLAVIFFCTSFVPKEPKIHTDKFVVIRIHKINDSDWGGFFWWVHLAISCILFSKKVGRRPLMLYNDGYYSDQKSNWWYTFFKYPVLTEKDRKVLKKVSKHYTEYPKVRSFNLDESKDIYVYDNDSFQTLMRSTLNENTLDYNTNFQPSDQVCRKLKNVQQRLKWPDKAPHVLNIAVHYRGTDKFYMYGGTEDLSANKHKEYKEVVDKISQYIAGSGKIRFQILVASDEQPFIEYVKEYFKDRSDVKVMYYDEAARSTANTGGVSLKDTRHCNSTNTHLTECKEVGKFKDLSIHRGLRDVSGYKKGEDAMIDVLLLSLADVYFQTHKGNIASQPKKIRKNLKIIYLS